MSLESRLYELSIVSDKGKEVYNLWAYIKNDISKQLNYVSVYFPHFSLHDSSHSATIISHIERILGEKRIEKLSFSDIFFLLAVAYFHDLGMVLLWREVNEYFLSDKYSEDLKSISKDENNPLFESAKRLIGLDFSDVDSKVANTKSLLVYEDVLKFVEFHFRSNHAKKSSVMVVEYLSNKLQIDKLIGVRLIKLMANICSLHQMDYKEIMNYQQMTNGILNDYCHPRFIAVMLCLGDLLDLDSDRFDNKYLEITTPLPFESDLHKQKHESIVHYLVNTKGIEIIAECESKDVYRLLQDWIEWIERLLIFTAINWTDISPEDFGNSPLLLKKEVSFKNNKNWIQYNDLKFTISNNRAIELLQGANIYQTKFVFIRELIQNAVDATLIQLHKRISNNGELSIATVEEIIKIINNYDINLKIKEIDGCVEILLHDLGTGVTIEDIQNMAKVGNRNKKTDSKKNIPDWLKPSGAFGLGLQSVFMIATSFEMITKTENEKAKLIRFESSASGKGYIDIEDYPDPFDRGTLVKIRIDNEKVRLEDLYCSRYSYETEDKSKLIIERLYNEYNNKSDGKSPALRWKDKIFDYVNVNWEIELSGSTVKLDNVLYRTIFNVELTELLDGKLNLSSGSLEFKYYDAKSQSICSLHFIDFYCDDKVIVYDNYDYLYNYSLFFKHEFVQNGLLKDRFESNNSNQYKNFDVSVNLLSGNAEKLLNINRNGVKADSKIDIVVMMEETVKNTCKKLIDCLIENKKSVSSLIIKVFEATIFYNYRTDELYTMYKDDMLEYSFRNYLSVNKPINEQKYNKTFSFNELNTLNLKFIVKELCNSDEIFDCDIEELSATDDVYWLKPSSIKLPQISNSQQCASHKIEKAFLGKLGTKIYYCIEVKPFSVGSIKNDFYKDKYILIYDFLFALVNNYRVMTGNCNYRSIGVSSEEVGPRKKALLLELNLPETIRSEVWKYLNEEVENFDVERIVADIELSKEYEKGIYYTGKMNNIEKEEVEKEYQKFIREILSLVSNKNYKTLIDKFLDEINPNPRNLYPSKSKLEDAIYSNAYVT